jgi:acyl phosphate:glycerol-3-phosphate acyltransferase
MLPPLGPLRLVCAAAAGYLLGTVPSADVAARLAKGGRVDLRESGSRNPGGVNALRMLGGTPGRAVIVADVAKGFAACASGRAAAGDTGAHVAGVAAVVGHCYPVWNGFRGGKGVATSFGQCLYTFPAAAPLDLAVAIGVARIPGLRQPALASTALSSAVWLVASIVWWRRRLPNSWGPTPTAALPLANAATVLVIASRFVRALRLGHPDDLEVAR